MYVQWHNFPFNNKCKNNIKNWFIGSSHKPLSSVEPGISNAKLIMKLTENT